MVFGTPTIASDCSPCSRAATPSVSSPPIATRASRLSPKCRTTRSTPPSTLYGFVRLVPTIVPPRGRMPEISRRPSGSSWFSTRPRQPALTPTTSWPRSSERRATARMTAFRPGQSPPPVRTPTRTGRTISGRSVCSAPPPGQPEPPPGVPALHRAPVVERLERASCTCAGDAVRVRMPPPAPVSLRRNQDVLAHRVQQPPAERAAVRGRPEPVRPPDLPPAGSLLDLGLRFEAERLEGRIEVRVLLDANDPLVPDGDDGRVAADGEVAAGLERAVVGRVELLARDPERDGDLVADPDTALDLDPVALLESVGEDGEHALVTGRAARIERDP